MGLDNGVKVRERQAGKTVVPSRREWKKVGRLINNIMSADREFLEVSYSPRGISLLAGGSLQIGTPFAGTIADNGTDIDIGKNRGTETYRFVDAITVGERTQYRTSKETITVIETVAAIASATTADVYVYYQLSGTSALEIELKKSDTYPESTETELNIVLGMARHNEVTISKWSQYQQGVILIPARFGFL